jgi:hypothetical protein
METFWQRQYEIVVGESECEWFKLTEIFPYCARRKCTDTMQPALEAGCEISFHTVYSTDGKSDNFTMSYPRDFELSGCGSIPMMVISPFSGAYTQNTRPADGVLFCKYDCHTFIPYRRESGSISCDCKPG